MKRSPSLSYKAKYSCITRLKISVSSSKLETHSVKCFECSSALIEVILTSGTLCNVITWIINKEGHIYANDDDVYRTA